MGTTRYRHCRVRLANQWSILMFALLLLGSTSCGRPTSSVARSSATPVSERLPQLTVQGNDLIGENAAGQTEVVMPNHDRLAGWWIVRRGASKLTLQFLRAGEVHFSNR